MQILSNDLYKWICLILILVVLASGLAPCDMNLGRSRSIRNRVDSIFDALNEEIDDLINREPDRRPMPFVTPAPTETPGINENL